MDSSDCDFSDDVSDEPLTYTRISINGPMANWEQHTKVISI